MAGGCSGGRRVSSLGPRLLQRSHGCCALASQLSPFPGVPGARVAPGCPRHPRVLMSPCWSLLHPWVPASRLDTWCQCHPGCPRHPWEPASRLAPSASVTLGAHVTPGCLVPASPWGPSVAPGARLSCPAGSSCLLVPCQLGLRHRWSLPHVRRSCLTFRRCSPCTDRRFSHVPCPPPAPAPRSPEGSSGGSRGPRGPPALHNRDVLTLLPQGGCGMSPPGQATPASFLMPVMGSAF